MAWVNPQKIIFKYKTQGAIYLEGVAVGTIVAKAEKRAERIEGDFMYQLPGDKMLWGRKELRRAKPGHVQNWD
jgi:hypothetical protein